MVWKLEGALGRYLVVDFSATICNATMEIPTRISQKKMLKNQTRIFTCCLRSGSLQTPAYQSLLKIGNNSKHHLRSFHTSIMMHSETNFPFTQTQYLQAINRVVDKITEKLDGINDDCSSELEDKEIDMEVEGGHDGVINVKISKAGKDYVFVISRQTPARELWLSSALSGPWHYRYDHVKDDWNCTREGEEKFWTKIQRELSQVLEQQVSFEN